MLKFFIPFFKIVLKIIRYVLLLFLFLILLRYVVFITLGHFGYLGGRPSNATPLIRATAEGDLEKMKILLNEGNIDINYVDDIGGPALVYAVVNDDMEAVKLLLAYGANINERYHADYGPTPIVGANAKMTQFLLDNGAYLNTPHAIFEGVIFLKLGTLEVLLANGADIALLWYWEEPYRTIISIPYSVFLYFYMPPLIKAIYEDDIDKVKELLDDGADVNTRFTSLNITPLMMAAQKANVPIMQLLIEHGADINAQSKTGWNALFFVLGKEIYRYDENKLQAIQILIDNGININAQNNSGVTPLMRAITLRGDGNAQGYKKKNPIGILLENGAEVSTKTSTGNSALYYALNGVELEALDLLLKNGADINEKFVVNGIANNTVLTSIYYNASYIHYKPQHFIDAIKLLISHGADVHTKNDEGKTALMHMLEIIPSNNKTPIGRAYFRDKKDEDIFNEKIKKALPKEITRNTIEAMQILLDEEADINAVNNKGQNVLLYALEFWKFHIKSRPNFEKRISKLKYKDFIFPLEIVQFLLDNGVDINAKDKSGKTALDYAKEFEQETGESGVIELLLKHGAKSGE